MAKYEFIAECFVGSPQLGSHALTGVDLEASSFVRRELDVDGYCRHVGIELGDLTKESVCKARQAELSMPEQRWIRHSHRPID